MADRAIERANVGRSVAIRIEPDRAEVMEIGVCHDMTWFMAPKIFETSGVLLTTL